MVLMHRNLGQGQASFSIPQPLLNFPEVEALEDQKPTALCSVPQVGFVWSFLVVRFKASLFWLESLRTGIDSSHCSHMSEPGPSLPAVTALL